MRQRLARWAKSLETVDWVLLVGYPITCGIAYARLAEWGVL